MGGLLSREVYVSPRRWLLLPVETKAREMDGKALLAFEAAERGFGTIIGRRSMRERTDLPPGMFIEKSIAPGRSVHIRTSLDRGRRVSAWCEEGLVYKNAEEYGLRMVERQAYELLETYFAWGHNQRDDMVGTLEYDPEKIVVTGHPRFDIHRPEFRGILLQRTKQIRDLLEPFILVNSSFPVCNNYLELKDVLSRMRKPGTNPAAQEAGLRALGAYQAENFAKFRTMVAALSRRYPNYRIVVRPHPSESHDPWDVIASDLPNVRVIYRGNVIEWLLAAEISIHNECTTGIEAYLLDRPTIAYRAFSDQRFDLYLPNALSTEANGLDHLLSIVDKVQSGDSISGQEDAAAKATIANRYIANSGAKAACPIVMDRVDRADLPETALYYSRSRLADLAAIGRRPLRPIKSAFQRRDAAARQRYTEQKFEGAHRSELQDFLDAARKATGRFGNVEVRELEKDLFCVYQTC